MISPVAVSVMWVVLSAMCVAVSVLWNAAMYMLTIAHHNPDIGMSGVGELFLHHTWQCNHWWLCQW